MVDAASLFASGRERPRHARSRSRAREIVASAIPAAACAVLALVGCGGSSAPKPPTGGPTFRLAIPAVPRTLDTARVADLPSLNVAHELYAGLTRFSGRGVVPDLAESWEPSENGLVWTFHLRNGIRWSDGEPITSDDFRRAWLHALDPKTGSPYARAEMLNVKGALRYHATGSGDVGIEAPDDRTLRVTLEHPVPWLDEQVAYPVFFPALRPNAWSGPFRLVSRGNDRLVLARNGMYWNAAGVKPRRIVLTSSTKGVDGILPRGLAAPGFPWIDTSGEAPAGSRELPTLTVGLLWLVTKGTPLADPNAREIVDSAVGHVGPRLATVVPPAMPGASTIVPHGLETRIHSPAALRLTLAYAEPDARAARFASRLRAALGEEGTELTLRPASSLRDLVRLAGPPAQPGIDMVLLGWSAEYFDAYNILDLFPCASALNVARWCDPAYDGLMRRAVRTLDDEERYRTERELAKTLNDDLPALPLYSPKEHVFLKPGGGGFRWSPIGFYELAGMTRS
jgi:oligopeptide transport system substrate-binding protein